MYSRPLCVFGHFSVFANYHDVCDRSAEDDHSSLATDTSYFKKKIRVCSTSVLYFSFRRLILNTVRYHQMSFSWRKSLLESWPDRSWWYDNNWMIRELEVWTIRQSSARVIISLFKAATSKERTFCDEDVFSSCHNHIYVDTEQPMIN